VKDRFICSSRCQGLTLLIVLSVLAEPRALFAHPPSRRGTTELVPSSIYSHFSTLMCRTHCRQGRWLCSQVGMPSPLSHQVSSSRPLLQFIPFLLCSAKPTEHLFICVMVNTPADPPPRLW